MTKVSLPSPDGSIDEWMIRPDRGQENLGPHKVWREQKMLAYGDARAEEAREDMRAEVEALRRAHERANAEALRLAEELRKRDPSWGKPMILNDAAVEK